MKNSHLNNILFLLSCLLFVGSFPAEAFEKDSEGYPVMYLRGDMKGLGWGYADWTRFSREGEQYTLHLDELSGEFKISDTDWNLSYGSTTGSVEEVYANTVVQGIKSGKNYHASGLRDVTITFTLTYDSPCLISFTADTSLPLSGTLPVLYINARNDDGSINPEIADYNLSHKEYFTAEYWIENAGEMDLASGDKPLATLIKARGNWTRTAFVKKPFKLKLDKKQSLLGLSKSKHFALLAHADDDYGFLRNFTAFMLGKRLGLPWTPSMVPVELVLNGDYRGIYFLTESIRAEKERVDIEELEDGCEDPAMVSGGYIVELDNYEEPTGQIRMPEISTIPGDYSRTLRITFDTPEVYSDLQTRFITDQFNAINRLVGTNDDSMWSYLDLDDAARYYLVCELTGHSEAYNGSTYLFRNRGEGEKWHFSPLWDFGNAFKAGINTLFYSELYFPHNLVPSFVRNEKFVNKVKETWSWLLGSQFEGVYDEMSAYISAIKEAAKKDAQRWKNAGRTNNNGVDVKVNEDVEAQFAVVKNYLETRKNWLKGIYGEGIPGAPEPSRDLTTAAPLPEYAKADAAEIIDEDSAYQEFYTIEGIRVSTPEKGQLYIIRQGSSARKVIY